MKLEINESLDKGSQSCWNQGFAYIWHLLFLACVIYFDPYMVPEKLVLVYMSLVELY